MEKIRKLFENKRNIYILYSLTFALMCLIVFSYYYLNGKTLIFYGDSWYQHYKALYYYSDYLKTIVKTLFSEHRFVIPMWDMSIGEGSDIISALHYYCIGDPITFLSVFVPQRYIYLYFDLSIILRLYLSGLFFIILCCNTGKDNPFAILSGSMIYVFCYWNILNAVKHIFFLNPMIYLPLIILGVEKIIAGKRPYVLILSVAFSALSSFYFFYMIVILTIIYVAVRLVTLYGRDYRSIFYSLFRIFFASLTGFLCSAVISLPIIYALLTNNRLNVDYGLHLIYPYFYYERLITIMLTTDNYYWLCMGFASPVILSSLLAFKQAKKDRLLFALNLISLFMVVFPIFGKIMNGMAYVTNRWSFALALLSAYTFVAKWDEYKDNKRYLYFAFGVFFCLTFYTAWWRFIKIVPILIAVLFLLLVTIDVKFLDPFRKQILMLILVLASILYTADYSNSIRGRNRASGAVDVNDAIDVATATEAYEFKEFCDSNHIDDFVRYSGTGLTTNAAMLADVYSTDYYFSIANPFVSTFRSEVGINEYSSYWYGSYDERAIFYSLANVGYYIAPAGFDGKLPYGFEQIEGLKNYQLYKNNYVLPFGYTYDKSISLEEWSGLSQIQKEESLLYAVVKEDGKDHLEGLKTEKVPYRISDNDLFEISDGSILVKEEKSSLKIDVDGKEGCMTYLSFDNLNYDGLEDYFFGDEMTLGMMTIKASNGTENYIEYHNNDYQFYNGKHYFSAYLGEGKIDWIEITFTRGGLYSFDEMYISCLPIEGYDVAIDSLEKECLENVEFGINTVSGEIKVDEEKYLLLSIPFSKGWTAMINGNTADLSLGNECYMTLKLEKGLNKIMLNYETPFLKTGLMISFLSFFALICFVVFNEKKIGRNGHS